MRTKWMGMLVATAILASLAIAAVALGPANLLNLGSPGGGNTAQASSIGVPTWHVGDFWTYHVNASSAVPPLSAFGVTGNVTRLVSASDGGQYNVNCNRSVHVGSPIDIVPSG